MAKQNKIELIDNDIGGYDLGVERDGGNPVRILTGNRSLKFWKDLREVADEAIKEIKYNKKHGLYHGS